MSELRRPSQRLQGVPQFLQKRHLGSENTQISSTSKHTKMEQEVDGLNQDPKNLRAISIFASYLLTCCLLTGLIIRDLLIQHRIRQNGRTLKALPPRPTAAMVFATCAIGSLGVTWYYMLSFFSLSYRAWALQHSVQLPSIPKTIQEIGNFVNAIHLGAWLKDVKLFKDAWEVAMETPGRLFWSSPIFFISTIWAIFVGDEGTRSDQPLQAPSLTAV